MLGKKHRAITDWLVNHWAKGDRRVCVLEGFSGVGKTEVASEFERRAGADARVDAPESGSLDDLLLDISQQLAFKGEHEIASSIASGKSLEAAFEAVMMKPVRIIVDEFQRLVDLKVGSPDTRVALLIERISKRSAPGRLLLLSHHSLDKTTRWGERVEFKSLEGLSPEEGAQLLSELLGHRGRLNDIPAARRAEISRWLGGNPRGIRVLVGALEEQALNDLTGVVPEAWEARDQHVSESLIAKLERELLFRALENLDGPSASTLEALSVYRKAVDKEGVTRLLKPEIQLDTFLTNVSARFLLEQRAGRYALNPVVREISLHRLKASPRSAQVAHRAAAGYYTRHFAAKQIVNATRLGGAFVEARYHLVQCGDTEELPQIVQSFGGHLNTLYGWGAATPSSGTQLDEAIGVLLAYLQTEGPKSMEYHLARLLHFRDRQGDHERALQHSRKSTGPQSPEAPWVLRLRLEAKVGGVEAMLLAAQECFSTHTAVDSLVAVYRMAAELLAAAGRLTEAIDLVEEGLKKIRPERNSYSLYLLEADLLVDFGHAGDALLLLRQALTTIPAEHNLFAIYERAAHLLDGLKGVDEAVGLLRDGIQRIPPDKGLYILYTSVADLLLKGGHRAEALGALEEGLRRVPTVDRAHLKSALLRYQDQGSSAPEPPVEVTEIDVSTVQKKLVASSAKKGRLSVLAIGTEWESRHGGLSTFNREFSVELAKFGHDVVCLLPEITEAERKAAEKAGVRILASPPQPGLDGTDRLLVDLTLPDGFHPDFVIGHDRKTGPYARVLARRFKTKFVLFVHTRPEDIEWHKDKLGDDDAATSAESRKRLLGELAAEASLVVGVGPALTESVRTLVYVNESRPLVHQFNPGFKVSSRPPDLPPEFQVLLLGRTEDYALKGLDIAALAVAKVTTRGKIAKEPRLVVRGAPPGTGADLRKRLLANAGSKLNVEVRDYSPDMSRLKDDILSASVVIMPSRSEGFGLVALEAVAVATPILVSDASGFAMLLREVHGAADEGVIVETQDDLNLAAAEWERAIERVLQDRAAAFARALEFRAKLEPVLDWGKAIQALESVWVTLLER